MNKLIAIAILLLVTGSILSTLAFTEAWKLKKKNISTDYKSAAVTNQTSGMFIFVNSKPVAEYTFLETIKVGVTWSNKPDEVFNNVVKRARKDHPDADGLIFQDMSLEKADVIKFK